MKKLRERPRSQAAPEGILVCCGKDPGRRGVPLYPGVGPINEIHSLLAEFRHACFASNARSPLLLRLFSGIVALSTRGF